MEAEVALVRIAQSIRKLRRLRRDEFGLALGEPAWDMLLELYYRDNIGVATTAAQLKKAPFCADSSAERWLRHLKQGGFVRIKPHPSDQRTEFVELSEIARSALENYLIAVRALAAQEATEHKLS